MCCHIVLLEFYLEGLWGEYYIACGLAAVKLKKLKKLCILWLLQDNRTFILAFAFTLLPTIHCFRGNQAYSINYRFTTLRVIMQVCYELEVDLLARYFMFR